MVGVGERGEEEEGVEKRKARGETGQAVEKR